MLLASGGGGPGAAKPSGHRPAPDREPLGPGVHSTKARQPGAGAFPAAHTFNGTCPCELTPSPHPVNLQATHLASIIAIGVSWQQRLAGACERHLTQPDRLVMG